MITIRNFIIGSAIGLLNVAVTSRFISDRPVGASTSYPYVSDWLLNLEQTTYFQAIEKAGVWEMWFLLGAFFGALFGAVLFKHFKVQSVPTFWAYAKGGSIIKRLAWALLSGFILIFGARLADGCTSGHILSGGMELAVSSIVFAIFVAASSMITAKVFYRGRS